MLQQTRVDTVVPYYARFLERFPTAMALAEAPADDVLSMWSGLGYYRRARLLHQGARTVAERGGSVPRDRNGLLDVPGIGRYTAGAIASIAFGEPVGLVDGNVARVLSRIFAIEEDMRKAGMRKAEKLADVIVGRKDPGAWNQALMELGATVCTPRSPSCEKCPVADMCRARLENRVSELPVLSARTAPTVVRMQALVATKDKCVVLARRREGLLFGGLWEPPAIEGDEKARAKLRKVVPTGALEHVGTVSHVLSHRKLLIDVLSTDLVGSVRDHALPDSYEAVKLVTKAGLTGIGVATLTRKILARAGVFR